MPLNDSASTSLINGAPRVVRQGESIRVVQSRAIGWALTALGLGLPAAILSSGDWKWPADGLAPLGYAGLAVLLLFFGGCALYGLFWLIWRRELTLDLATGNYRFVTGLWPRLHTFQGPLDAPLSLELHRKLMTSRHGMGGEAGAEIAGKTRESWQLALTVPGASEPLFLGEWCQRADVLAEIEAWRAVLPRATLVESGDAE